MFSYIQNKLVHLRMFVYKFTWKKKIGITMVAQVCVLTLFPCSFQDLVALMSQKKGTLVSLQDDEKKRCFADSLVVFGMNVISKSWQTTWRYEATGALIKRNVSLLTGGFFIM